MTGVTNDYASVAVLSYSEMENPNVLPSPASSPPPTIPTTLDISSKQPSRKRPRSPSLLSESSKRAVSEDMPSDIRSPRADTITDSNQDIDAYMAEQGEADIPTTMTIPTSASQNATNCQSVPPAEKLSIVTTGCIREMEIGETWYLISRDWWRRWEKACTGEADKDGPVNEQELGPVNNAGLLDQYGNLQTSLVEGVDVEYIPEETWHLLVSW